MNRQSPQKGAAFLLLVIFFMMGSLLVTLGVARTITADLVRARTLLESKQALFAVESGVEDVVFRSRAGDPVSASETLNVAGVSALSSVATVINERLVRAEAQNNGPYRTSFARLRLGEGVSFSFGLQSGDGGLVMKNSSSVIGDVYANGPVDGSGTTASNGNYVYGHIISAGPAGLVEGVVATGSIWANEIDSATAEKQAYYQTISANSRVQGSACPNAFCHPGSADQPFIEMPISTTTIEGWKTNAANGGTILATDPLCPGGTMTINSSTTTGPRKIECDVIVEGNSTTWSLSGAVWISGNLTVRTNADIAVDASLADLSPALIVDNPSNRLTSSKIDLNQGGDFVGAAGNSFLILISMNESASLGGSEVGLNAANSVGGDALLYVPDGRIVLSQSISVKELTAHTVELQNSTQVRYESGLLSIATPDPDGGYSIEEWREVD